MATTTATKTLPGAKAVLKGKTITAKKSPAPQSKAAQNKIANKAMAPAKVKIEKPKLEELTIEAALKMVKAGDWVACVKAPLGSIYTVRVGQGEIYSNVLIPADKNKKTQFVQTHVDRVSSPRHLPRTLRILGSWLGTQGGFENGAKAKDEE